MNLDSLANQRIFAKITATVVIIGTGVMIYQDHSIFQSQAIKEIVLFLLGGSTAFLFNKD